MRETKLESHTCFNFFPEHLTLHGWLSAFHLHEVLVTSKLKRRKKKKKEIPTMNLSLHILEMLHMFTISKIVQNMKKTYF